MFLSIFEINQILQAQQNLYYLRRKRKLQAK